MDKLIFKVSLHMKRLLYAQLPEDSPPARDKFIKLPEVEVPFFDGNFLNWREFWKQFNISVHRQKKNCPTLQNWLI